MEEEGMTANGVPAAQQFGWKMVAIAAIAWQNTVNKIGNFVGFLVKQIQ
jgi:hypothetical protein